MKKLINKINWAIFWSVFSMITILFLNGVILNQRKEITELEGKNEILQATIDSCIDSNFEEHITNGRYEITLETLRERNPKAAAEFEQIMSHETE